MFNAGLTMARLPFVFLCAFMFILKWKDAQSGPLGNCPARNLTAAAEQRRRCRKPCTSHRQCYKNRRCICGHECGLSCIDKEIRCKIPRPINSSSHVEVYRKNSNGHYVPGASLPYKFNDMAEYVCKPGFVLYEEITHLCTGRGKWSNKKRSICTRSCEVRNDAKVSTNGMTCEEACVQDSDCNSGNKCRCDGPCGRTCVALDVNCGNAPPSNHTTIKYEGNGFFRIAYYNCDEGFFFNSGSSSRKCTGGGTWDGQLISCRPVECLDLKPSIEAMHGEMVNYHFGPYYVNDTLTVKCRGYHNHIGGKTRTCLSSGRWSGVDTVCDRKRQDNAMPRCRHPGVPVGGSLVSSTRSYREFGVAKTIRFKCDRHLVLVGEAEQKCLFNYEWSGGGAPQCVDPRIRDTASVALGKLTESTKNILASLPPVGRFIRTKEKASHEVYFVFDLSESVDPISLNNSLTFAVKLIQRLTADASGVVRYGVMVFASESKVIVDRLRQRRSPTEVIEEIVKIGLNRETIQKEIRSGTHTNAAITTLSSQIAFSYEQDGNEDSKERHVFILTDGKHNVGPPPQRQIDLMQKQARGPLTFYSITSCLECANRIEAGEAYEELLGLAGGQPKNFIFIENSYVISELLDQVTDARIDLSKCGQAGDEGSVRLQGNPGRVFAGNRASTRSWPWQVAISLFDKKVVKSYSDDNFRGGGSLINNRWVLTAAHLFDRVAQSENWEENYLLTFGIHQRPMKYDDDLPDKVKAYRASKIITHSAYFDRSAFDYDVALIEIGREYKQHGRHFKKTEMQGWVNYTEYIRPVCLPCMEGNSVGERLRRDGMLFGNETEAERCEIETDFLLNEGNLNAVLAVSTGFGITANETFRDNRASGPSVYLRQGLHKIRDDDFCNTAADEWLKGRWDAYVTIPYTNSMLCATSGIRGRNVDSCRGDSGGPLVTKIRDITEEEDKSSWVQIGIVSWGWGCGQSLRIGGRQRQVPGFYTNVMNVSLWINTTIEEN